MKQFYRIMSFHQPLPFSALNKQRHPLSNSLHPSKSSIQLYHQVFRQRKHLLNSQNRLQSRLNLVHQIQNKILRQSSIKTRQQEYKLKYKSLYTRDPTDTSISSSANIYRFPQSRKKLLDKQNDLGVQQMKAASEEYKRTIENNKRMEKERKHTMVNKVKMQKEQVRKTMSEFKEMRANRVGQIIQSKIQNERKKCVDVSKSIDKLSRSCYRRNRSYVVESLPKDPVKTYLFTKIL